MQSESLSGGGAFRWAKRGKPWREKLVVGVFLGILFSIGISILTVFVYGSGYFNCRNSWGDSGREWRYVPACGCQVRDKGGWIPERNVRTVD